MTTAWPVTLADGAVRLRPLSRGHGRAWRRLRLANAAWLEPWEATLPEPVPRFGDSFVVYLAELRREARAGRAMPFAIESDGALVGQVTASAITRGSLWSASVGYWVGQEYAGRGIAPTAVALVADHLWTSAGLHRVEMAIHPENAPSLRVAEKLGFREEGVRLRYLHVNGAWRDHRAFALTVEDVPGGLVRRWRERRAGPSR